MTRTRVTSLLVLAVVGVVLAGLLQVALASSGRPVVQLPYSLPLALAAIGAIVVTLAVPIRRMTRGPAHAPVDPFYATRVVALAKASALGGALLGGVGGGMLAYLLTRSAPPPSGSIAAAVAEGVGALVLMGCGLVAEQMCRVPPSDDDESDDERPIRATL